MNALTKSIEKLEDKISEIEKKPEIRINTLDCLAHKI